MRYNKFKKYFDQYTSELAESKQNETTESKTSTYLEIINGLSDQSFNMQWVSEDGLGHVELREAIVELNTFQRCSHVNLFSAISIWTDSDDCLILQPTLEGIHVAYSRNLYAMISQGHDEYGDFWMLTVRKCQSSDGITHPQFRRLSKKDERAKN